MYKITINAFPKTKIYVSLKEEFKKHLIDFSIRKLKLKNYYELALWINKKSEKYNINSKFNGGDVKYWLKGKKRDMRTNIMHPKFMPLWVICELKKLNRISIKQTHKNIISYRSGGKGKIVSTPKLPVEITPELESIIIHLFADGSAGDFTPSYDQKDNKCANYFISRLKNCFGNFEVKIYKSKNKSSAQYRFPKAITDIISEYYNIASYHSKKAIIPEKILRGKSKMNKLACVVAFISDEGNIRDVITLNSSNKIMLSQIKKLAENCLYICNPIRLNKSCKCYYFTISNKSINKFYKDIKKLYKLFPNCTLGTQYKKLEKLMKSRTSIKIRKTDVIYNNILGIIERNPSNAIQIANRLDYSYSSIRQHLKAMQKKNLVKRKYINVNYIWTKS
ncbi:MAG: winged helix-turn-helix domain-containing protein [Nanoarchaeota archaeon]|nr:winged helix-turn-helix domain-containing protein [Nanoarchaeota archaeon]